MFSARHTTLLLVENRAVLLKLFSVHIRNVNYYAITYSVLARSNNLVSRIDTSLQLKCAILIGNLWIDKINPKVSALETDSSDHMIFLEQYDNVLKF